MATARWRKTREAVILQMQLKGHGPDVIGSVLEIVDAAAVVARSVSRRASKRSTQYATGTATRHGMATSTMPSTERRCSKPQPMAAASPPGIPRDTRG